MCNDPYVDCVVDFNKNVSGYESCIVGEKSGFQPSKILHLKKEKEESQKELWQHIAVQIVYWKTSKINERGSGYSLY